MSIYKGKEWVGSFSKEALIFYLNINILSKIFSMLDKIFQFCRSLLGAGGETSENWPHQKKKNIFNILC